MPNFNQVVRHKRFDVVEKFILKLIVSNSFGEQIEFKILNCSINGLYCELLAGSISELKDDEILQNSKIVADDYEFGLGRIALRRILKNKENVGYAFSTIDTRIPISTSLSKFLKSNFNETTDEFSVELSDKGFTLADFITTNYGNVDILDRCEKFKIFYDKYSKSNKYGYFIPRTSITGPRVNLMRKRPNNRTDYLMYGSNDYLGLSAHPAVIEEGSRVNKLFGMGSTGTAPTSGTTEWHIKLCEKIAQMHGKDEALVFSSGYGANIGLIAGLVRENDLVVADILSHASLQDGMKMSGAKYSFFKHNDMNHLRKVLTRSRNNHSGCLIVTEGIFSMDGTVGRLDEIVKIAREFNCRVFVDQGHCFGVLGKKFLGAADELGVVDEIDITMGLFSKAIGTLGAYVVGKSSLISWYRGYARSLMFATTFPPGIAASTIKAIEIMQTGEIQERLKGNIKYFRQGLESLGYKNDNPYLSPVIPIEIRDEEKMGNIYQSLLDEGVFALPVIYPVVPRGKCRFRFSVNANHTQGDIDYTIMVIEKAFRKENFSFTPEQLVSSNEEG